MSAPDPNAAQSGGARFDPARERDFEGRVAAFESAWAAGNAPDIAVYLPGSTKSDAAARGALLRELVMIDLEMGWKRAARERCGRAPAGPLLEQYVKRFPELGPLERLPMELVAEEFRARLRWGDRPGDAEYVARFRHRAPELARRLEAVRRELEREFAPAAAASSGEKSAAASGEQPRSAISLDYRDFLLRRQIGTGGFCRVYTAVQRGADRPAAVKILKKQWRDSPNLVRRLLFEAELLRAIRHGGVPELYGTGRLPHGGYFLAMQLLAGRPLGECAAGASLPIDRAVSVAARLAEILAHVHAAGIVHGDVAPRNVLLDDVQLAGGADDGAEVAWVHLIDFGLARRTNSDGIAPPGDGALAGTAPFLAPEQIDPARGPITRATDIYALGAVLYWLLTGRPPFTADTTIELLVRIVSGEAAVPPSEERPEVPPVISDICLRCLAKDPRQRVASAADVAQSLQCR